MAKIITQPFWQAWLKKHQSGPRIKQAAGQHPAVSEA
jgi:hypothetical protein